MKKEEYSKFFIIICSINITCLLISNIITIKTINIFGFIFTAGDILFPITYILNDIFTEVYGFSKSKFIIWLSFFCNLFMVIIFRITILLPVNETFKMQKELVNILGSTPRILIASFISFLVGNFANSIIMSKMKVKTKGKYLALRTIVSTLIGEGLDTIIFIPIVFIGFLELKTILFLIIDTYILKVLLEVILTPVTYKVVGIIKKKESIDTFDNEQKYNIF
ncbi:MAG: queuosine precursor transporter [Clostridia bacterium]|nr:queuosine precursor transporter [Clostridia bacterium]